MKRKHWEAEYRSRIRSPEEAVRSVSSGNRVFIGSGCAQPQTLIRKLLERRWEVSDVELLQTFSTGALPVPESGMGGSFRFKSFYLSVDTRGAVASGEADYAPVHMSRLPVLFKTGRIPLHAALVQVTPPDDNGMCSLGPGVDVVKAACEAASVVIAQVNPSLPRTSGDSSLHFSRFHVLSEVDEPPLEYRTAEPGYVHRRIGHWAAALIEDGSTLAAGLSPSCTGVLESLKGKKNLGIHTDIFHDAFLDLVLSGAVTNSEKTIHQGKIVTSCCLGTKRLFDFISDNPDVELHPTEHVNDATVIGSHDRMVSISSANEVDLTGQVSSDSYGHKLVTGFGGTADFEHGAALSRNGRQITVLPSISGDGLRSRIVARLSAGGGVVLTRASVRFVATEFGSVDLEGLSIRERAVALINIAHPRFRQSLLEEAKKLRYVYADQVLPGSYGAEYPDRWETSETFKDGVTLFFRPIKPTDERALQEFHYSLPKQDVQTRFLGNVKAFPHRTTQGLCNIDYTRDMTIVGLLGGPESEQIVAVANYVRDEQEDTAEAAFTVAHELQGSGIGTFMARYLADIARAYGIRVLSAYVLDSNRSMLITFCRIGRQIRTKMEEGVLKLEIRLDEEADHCVFDPS